MRYSAFFDKPSLACPGCTIFAQAAKIGVLDVRYPAVLGVIRPPFLLLTPVCVLLGLAAAYSADIPLDWTAAALAMVGAVAAHMSVNALNEYEDFQSGLDLRTERTPFSGGSGTLVAHPALAESARMIGLGTLLLTAVCGVTLLLRVGLGLLPFGVVGLALVYFYTGRINANRWLCLIAPGLGFGPLMVGGTYYAVTGTLSLSVVLVSLVPFFLVSNLLLLNQFPDVDADRSVGRDNLPIAYGLRRSLIVYALFAALAYLSLGIGVAAGLFSPSVFIALATLPVALLVFRGVSRTIDSAGPLTPGIVPPMGLNVVLSLATPALVGAGMLIAG
jgi:1,4-dihydroxy-2-naphthoate octaprenyltransferase